MPYKLLYSQTSREQIRGLHPEIRSVIKSRIQGLKGDPFSGKRLERELSGYRSLRAKRFRIIYKVDEKKQVIEIHHLGRRKDIYQLFRENIEK